MRRANLISAAVVIAFCLGVIVLIIPRFVPRGHSTGDLEPSFMPYVATGLALLFMTAFAVLRLARPAPDDGQPTPLPAPSWLFIILVVLTCAAAIVALKLFGYLIAGGVLMAGFLALARAGLWPTVLGAITSPVLLWLILDRLLGFPLP